VATRAAQAPATDMFALSSDCIACHNNLVSPAGEDVSIGANWRGTMMANSARDPYWQASVRRETMDHPSKAADIEDECATMPYAGGAKSRAGWRRQGRGICPLADQPSGRQIADGCVGRRGRDLHRLSPDCA
jgi:hypothetical protein